MIADFLLNLLASLAYDLLKSLPSGFSGQREGLLLRNLTLEEWQQYVGPEVPYHATCPGKP